MMALPLMREFSHRVAVHLMNVEQCRMAADVWTKLISASATDLPKYGSYSVWNDFPQICFCTTL